MSRLDELERDRQIAGIRAMIAPTANDAAGKAPPADDEVEVRELTGFGDGFEPPRGAWRARMVAHRRSAGVFIAVAVLTASATALVGWFLRPTAAPVAAGSATIASADERGDGKTAKPKEPAPSASASSSATTIVVAVVGQVVSPGLVTLPAGARVSDAIAAAGGSLPGTDLTSINIARKVSDGEQIAVGVAAPSADSGADAGATQPAGGSGAKVNLNSASVTDLDSLPGIGPVLAQRIIDFRNENGPFTTVEELANVSGVGPSIMSKISGQVTV